MSDHDLSAAPVPAPGLPEPRFLMLRRFDCEAPVAPGSRSRLRPGDARWFRGDGLAERLARELCAQRALPLKELVEAYEFFARVRRRVRAATVCDLCCGHGLVGVLYALFERKVDEVVLVDRRRPESWPRILEADRRAAPWVEPKLRWEVATLERAAPSLPEGAALIAVHACGLRTERVIKLAIERRAPVGLLPCCRPHRRHPAPLSLQRALGADLAIDVDRTYTLERAGYRVRWDAIPASITPMNRVLIGVPGD
ncbi:MAG: methyltransferase domain-containing protein [Acidobacteria bacterium]|nr:MAG: methyltransferase domain-containing protein [Acidobacteriota bacterium]